jgi:hypothetical protein
VLQTDVGQSPHLLSSAPQAEPQQTRHGHGIACDAARGHAGSAGVAVCSAPRVRMAGTANGAYVIL